MKTKVNDIFTCRLCMREITESDAKLIVKWRAEPDVYKLFRSPHLITEQEHLEWFYRKYLKDDNLINFIAIEVGLQKPIGVFGIRRREKNCVEVSYLLDKNSQGKGYAQEAVLGMLEFAKQDWGASNAIAEIHKDNHASIKMIQRLQFCRNREQGDFYVYERKL